MFSSFKEIIFNVLHARYLERDHNYYVIMVMLQSPKHELDVVQEVNAIYSLFEL
jgi:hypothetical protein